MSYLHVKCSFTENATASHSLAFGAKKGDSSGKSM